jgi:pimeloyl-ACP methyl ester carboxylesterase
MTTSLRPPHLAGTAAERSGTEVRGPLARIVIASLVVGALTSAALVLVVFPGASEHVTTGGALLGFAVGWSMLAALSSRMTNSPQRWAYGPGAFLGAAGAALLTLAPGDQSLTAAAWVWPPMLLVLIVWSARRMRASLIGRSRWLLYPVLGVLTVTSLGAVAENVAMQRESSTAAMPGRLFDVGGYRLHLSCIGTGTPTVILESGLGGSSPLWSRIATATASTTRICSYDRAGTGWSDSAPGPRDSVAIAADLHRLLAVAGEAGPYVLVGHSTGGIYAMTYASRYPEQVAGMVLLDSASPRQFSVLPDYASQYPMLTRLYAVRPALYRLGVGRIVPVLSSNEIPGRVGKQASIFAISPRDARAARDEVATYRHAFAQAQGLTSLGSKPLIVVSASETVAGTAGWSRAQQELVSLSANSTRRIAHSSHAGLLDHQGSYQASVTAITDVVHAVRTGTTVRPRS